MSRSLALLVAIVAATTAPGTALASPGQIGAGVRTNVAAEGFGDGVPEGFGDFWDEQIAATDGVARSTYNWPPPAWGWPFGAWSCPETGCASWHSRALGAVDVPRGKLEAYAESSLLTGGFEADNAGYSQTLGTAFLDDTISLSHPATVVLRGHVGGQMWAAHSHIDWYGDPRAVLAAEAFFSVRAPPESEVPWQEVGGFRQSYEPTVYGCPYPDTCAVGPGVPGPAPRRIDDSFEIEVPLEAGTSFFSAELFADVDLLVWGAEGDPHRTAHAMDALIDSASSLEFEIVVPGDVCATSGSGLLPIEGPQGVAVIKHASPDPVRVGDDLTYTVTVVNCGPGPATGVMLTDTLPADVTVMSASSTQGTCPRPGGVEDRVTCDIGTVAEEDRVTVTIVVRPSEAGPLTNSATVRANEPDADPSDNTDTVTTRALTLADLSVTKTATPSSVDVVPGTLNFRLAVRNDGPQLANDVTLTDTLPAGSSLVSATPSRGTCSGTAVVTCDLGTLASGEGATVDIAVTVRVGKEIPNTARVNGRDVEDPNEANNTAQTVTPCPPCAELAVENVEVTQGIQFLGDPSIPDNSVPLIQDKVTLVRVYFKDALVPGVGFNNITGGLSTFVCGQATPIRPSLPNGNFGPAEVRPVNAPKYPDDPNLDDANNLNRSLSDQRSDLNRTLNFLLPRRYTRPCTDLEVTISSPNAPAAATSRITGLKFETVPDFKVRLYSLVIPLTNAEPREIDRALLALWLRRGYPISDLVFEEGHFWRPTTQPCWLVDFDLTTHKWMNIAGGEDWRFKYYAMQNDDAGFMRGCTIGGPVGSGPSGVPGGTAVKGGLNWDADASYGDWYGAHELGHTHGRAHVNARGDEPDPDPNYPYPAVGVPGGRISPTSGGCTTGPPAVCGSLWGVELRFAGLTNPAGSGSNPDVVPPDWVDVMSYGNRQWISDYTYKAIKDHIQLEGTAPADSTAIIHSGPPGPGPPSEHVAVFGLLDLDDGTVQLDTLHRLPDQIPILGRTPGPYSVRLVDGAGATLADYPFTPQPIEEQDSEGAEPELAAISELVPYDSRTARIAVLREEVTLAERAVSANAPVVTMLSPMGGGTLEGDTVQVRWDVSDADGDALTAFVSYSADGGNTWSPAAARVTGTEVEIDVSRLRGTTEGRFMVLVSDGVNTGRAVTPTPFSVPDKPPRLVLSRSDPLTITEGQILGVSAVGLDPEEGLLDEDALEWRSDEDGLLANGSVLMTGLLSSGTHVLTVTGSDSDGNEASASMTAVVEGGDDTAPAVDAVLSPPPNPAGWNRGDVAVSLTADDGEGGSGAKEIRYTLSGAQTHSAVVAGGEASVTVSAEGVTTLSYAAVDNAGNESALQTLTIRIDRTPPRVTATRTPEPNARGWNSRAVTARFEANDMLSGLDGAAVTEAVLGEEGAGQSVTRTFLDRAGNAASAVVGPINIDLTPPVVSCRARPKVLRRPNHRLVRVSVSVAHADALSGPAGFVLTRTASSEPDDARGPADGRTRRDIRGFLVGTPDTVGLLRAERSARGRGRVYSLTYQAADLAGHVSPCTATVRVPKKASGSGPAKQSGR
jgi:uncharacterized repeat protein (TIGR01451 family)